MPDESPVVMRVADRGPRAGAFSRLAARLRRAADAELLAIAPEADEEGNPLVWDFPHPQNHSPAWRLLRPWMLVPVLLAGLIVAMEVTERTEVPTAGDLIGIVLLIGVVCTLVGQAIYSLTRRSVQRLALRTYRRWRWRGTTAQHAMIAAALERDRMPRPTPDADPRLGNR